MIDWLIALERLLLVIVPHLKALHVLALMIWCAGLLVLPFMLAHHDPANTEDDYRRIRRATHLTYTAAVTPAAVTAVIAGTWLVFLRDTFTTWFYLKLLIVAVLVSGHAWIGHMLVKASNVAGPYGPTQPRVLAAVVLLAILAILVLVLGKPDLGDVTFPGWLTEPRGGQLPFDVPRR